MIEFDYKIVRDEVDETKTYEPKIPKRLDDLIYIEGPNSSGKSTLLNILATGLFGLKTKNVKSSLQKKMKDLLDSSHQKVTFSFKITNSQNHLSITSEKKDPNRSEFMVYEIINDKKIPLSYEAFDRKYRLIYDIPENPLERLNELIIELKESQQKIGKVVSNIKMWIRETITQISCARDPKKLGNLIKLKDELIRTNNNLIKSKTNLENETTLLKRYFHARFYLEYIEKSAATNAEIWQLEKDRKTTKTEKREESKRHNRLYNEATLLSQEIKNIFLETCYDLKKIKIKTRENYMDIWSRENISDLLSDEEKQPFLLDGIQAFKERVVEIDKKEHTEEKIAEANFLRELIKLLEHYSKIKLLIPGTDKTVTDFRIILNEQYKKYTTFQCTHEFYNNLLDKLDKLYNKSRTYIKDYLKEVHKLYTKEKSYGIIPAENMDILKIDEIREKYKNYLDVSEHHMHELIKLDIKKENARSVVQELEKNSLIKPYLIYEENQLKEKLVDTMNELSSIENNIDKNNYIINRHQLEIERLERQEPHKYHEYQEGLENLLEKIQILEQRLLNEFDGYLTGLLNDNIVHKPSGIVKKYYEFISIYLGRKVDTIQYIDGKYKVDRIDLVNKKIHTQSKKIIHFTDMGTGQIQSAFLTGLLSFQDKRKVIALIDEVATMDSNSMKPVLDILKEQYRKGNLLGGIIVQKGEELKVTSF